MYVCTDISTKQKKEKIIMKIRISGTKEELAMAEAYYRSMEKDEGVKYVSISRPYANRGSETLFRLYVDLEYRDVVVAGVLRLECKGE